MVSSCVENLNKPHCVELWRELKAIVVKKTKEILADMSANIFIEWFGFQAHKILDKHATCISYTTQPQKDQ